MRITCEEGQCELNGLMAAIKVKEAEIERLRALLSDARDYIGRMPTIDAEGKDRFFDALGAVYKIESALSGHQQQVQGSGE